MTARWTATLLIAGSTTISPAASSAQTVYQMVEPYTALGIEDGRDHSVAIDDVATVDPFTGMLHVRHTDLEFHGVGPTIRVRRSFNSHPVRAAGGGAPVLRAPSLMAVGWDFHFVYVKYGDASGGATVNCDVFTPTPIERRIPRLVFPDGRELPLFQPTTASGNPHHFVGSSSWVADCLTGSQYGFRVIDPDGTAYLFTRWSVLSTDASAQTFGYMLDEVRDVHGNALTFTYQPASGLDEIQSISAADGRLVTFSYEAYLGGRRLREVTAFYRGTLRESWLYTYDPVPGVPGYSYLSRVEGPEGLAWSYTYETTMPGLHDIKTISSPFGATKSFEYGLRSVPATVGLGTTVAVSRTIWSGPQMPTAEWTYAYAPSPVAGELLDITTITTPDTVEVWTFCGERAIADPSLDPLNCTTRIGSLERKDIFERTAQGGQGLLLQSETFSWNGVVLSEQSFPLRHMPLFVQVPHAILRGQHTIARDGELFTTHHGDYDPLALQPTLISDYRDANPSVARQRLMQLWIDPTAWIVRTSSDALNDYIVDDPLFGSRAVGSNGVSNLFNPDGTVSSQTVKGVTDAYTYRSDGLPSTYTTYGTGGHFEARSYELDVVTELYSTGRDATLRRTLNAEGYIDSETDWEGHTTRLYYDGLGRVRRVETPRVTDEDVVATRSFTAREAVITRGGYTQRTRFDGLGRPYESVTDDILIRTERDARGRIIFESDPVSASVGLPAQCVNPAALNPCASVNPTCPGTCTTYDALGRVIQEIYSVDGSTTDYAYPTALQTEITNAKGQVTTITHERFGDPDENRPIRIEQEEGVTTTISYYINGHPKTVAQDGDGALFGPPRTFLLDEDHRLVGELHPESDWRRYVYDTNGRLAQSYYPEEGTGAQLNLVNHEYDDADRLRNYGPSPLSERVTLTYDRNNRVLTHGYKLATWTYGYDANGNRISESLQMDGRTFSFGRMYDDLDYLSHLVYPSARAVDYAPDVLGRPTQALPHVSSISYHPNGMLHRLSYANGHTMTYTPDADKPALPARIAGGPIDLAYTYDILGNVMQITDAVVASNDAALGYDRLNRLTSATGRWGAANYLYNLKNGITQMTLNGLATDYSYGYESASAPGTYQGHHLRQTVGRVGTRLSHDRRGNATFVEELPDPSSRTPTERRVDQFTYDWRDRPTQHIHQQIGLSDSRGSIVEIVELQKTTSYRYDGHGQRVSKGPGHVYVYSGEQLLYEEDHQEKSAREYIHVGALGVAEVIEDCQGASGTQPWCMSADQPPKVAILTPRTDARPDHRAAMILEAVAFDAESGDLSSQVQWYEALSTVGDPWNPPPATFLGQGRTFDLGVMTTGYHRIEARLPYGAGQAIVESVQFEVVAGPNTGPTIVGAPSAISTTVGTPLLVDMAPWFTDVDGDPLSYTVQNLPPWLSVLGSQLMGTPSASDAGAVIQVTAFDGLESSLALTVEVRIDAPPIVWTGTPLGDTFHGGPGHDTLDGLDGTDHLYGEGGDDTLFGGLGDFDHLWGGAGDDVLDGGPGDYDQLNGGDGNDRLEAGPGHQDFLDGGHGNDLFVYRSGDGHDMLRDFDGIDELYFPDLSPVDVSFQYSGSPPSNVADTRIIHVFDLAGQPLLQIGDTSAIQTSIETVRFMDGSTWTIEELIALVQPTAGDDLLFGGPGNDTIEGGAGNDLLVGNEGADTLRGGPGDDVMYGGYSTVPADDTFVFSQPIGQDTVYDYYGANDTFVFEDVASTDIGFEAHPQDLVLVGAGWRIIFYGHWAPVSYAKLERLQFSNGVVWDQATLEANYQQAVP